mgnify:CR=1 FL=1
MSEEAFLPWERAEKPAPATDLQEKLERQQISQLHYLDNVGPTGSRGLVLELTTGARLIVWAGRARGGPFSARLFFRWLPRPLIVLPRMERVFSGGRSRNPLADPPDELQRRVEGSVIHGVLHSKRPTSNQGEQCAIEMVGGGRLALAASPIMKNDEDGDLMLADLVYEWSEQERTHIHGV